MKLAVRFLHAGRRAALLLLFVCAATIGKAQSARENLNQLYDQYWEELLQRNPTLATSLGDLRYNDQFPINISYQERAATKAWQQAWLAKIQAIDPAGLTGSDLISYRMFRRQLELAVEGQQLDYQWMMPLSQQGGIHSMLALMGSGASTVPFKTVKDYNDWLVRLRNVPAYMDTLIGNMRQGIRAGYVLPRPLVEKLIPQLVPHTTTDTAKSLFYGPIRRIPAGFSARDKAYLSGAYASAITYAIAPSYQKLHDFLKTEYLPAARSTHGLSAIPNGDKAYAYLVKFHTTTNLTPDEIHNIGLREVARIQKEMLGVMKQVKFKGTLQQFFDHLRDSKQMKPYKTDEEVIAAYYTIRDRMMPKVNQYFGLQPKSAFEVRPVERFRVNSTAANYMRGTADGSRPGIFYVPIRDATQYQRFIMESLFLHEAIPGHHFQRSLQMEVPGLPKFRANGGVTAFAEGWGLYCESLGKELGLYTDPYQYFGRLDAEIHRAIRLVVDTGIHSKGWTREQAIQYSLANEGRDEASVVSEIERYMANPGQALSYKIGELKMMEMRGKAEKTLGKKFSLRAFHDEMLRDGDLPLDLFEQKINAWIATQS